MYKYYTRYFSQHGLADIDEWIASFERPALSAAYGSYPEIAGYASVGQGVVITLQRWEYEEKK